MKLSYIYIVVFINVLFFGSLSGQEILFTQYELSPTIVNPALTGQFSGTYRVQGVFRNQYTTATPEFSNDFNTYSITADVPIVRGIRKQDWIGGGINLRSSTVGTNGLKRSSFELNLAYHLAMNKKQTNILSLGAQFSSGGLSIEDFFRTTANILGLGNSTAHDQVVQGQSATEGIDLGSLNDLQVGFLYNVRGKKGTDFKIGVAVDGILSPSRAKTGNGDTKSLGINGLISYVQPMNKRTFLEHGLFYQSQDGASKWNINSRMNYKLNPKKDLYLIAGIGTRAIRSVLFYTGVRTGPWKFGLAFDLDIDGSIQSTGGYGALELGVAYLGIINKKPKPDPIIYCPRI